MSDHNEFPVSIKHEKTPNPDFFQWLKSNAALFISHIAALTATTLYIFTFLYYVVGYKAGSGNITIDEYLAKTQSIIFTLNVCFCIVFMLISVNILHKNEEGEYQALDFLKSLFRWEASKQENSDDMKMIKEGSKKYLLNFKKYFLLYWVYALSYYLIKLSKPLVSDTSVLALKWFTYITSCMNGLVMVFAAMLLDIILNSKNLSQNRRMLSMADSPYFFTRFFCSLFIAGITVYGFLVGFSENEIAPMPSQLFNAYVGILNMVSLGLLISRLDSKLIGIPSYLVSILYGYAVIQSLDYALEGTDVVSKAVITSAFVLTFLFKIYFFFILIYILQTGRLLGYFYANGEMSYKLIKGRKYER